VVGRNRSGEGRICEPEEVVARYCRRPATFFVSSEWKESRGGIPNVRHLPAVGSFHSGKPRLTDPRRICRLRGLRRARVIKRCCPSQHACRDVGLAESGFALPLTNRISFRKFAFRNLHFSASLSGLHSSLIDKFERFRADTDLSSKRIIHSA